MPSTQQLQRRTLLICAFIALVTSIIWQSNRSESSRPSNAVTSTETANVAARTATSSQREAITEADRRMIEEKALTDMTVSVFPAREYTHQPQPAGKSAGAPAGQAYIHVPSIGRRVSMEPNQIGEFPTIETKLKDTVGVRLLLDDVKPGTPVRVAIMDGGTFPLKEGLAQIIRASDKRGISFEFTTSINIGHHRILVEAQGHPARLLNFSAHDATWPALSQSPTN
jgi:hypothetical protein